MPLIKSPSRAAMSQNIFEMVHAGHPQKQAIAASYANARKYGAKFQFGGAAGMPFGIGTSAPQAGAGMGAAMPAPAMPAAGPMLRGSPAAMPAQPMPQPVMGGGVGQQNWWSNPAILSFLSRFRGGLGGGGYGGMKRGGVPRMQAGGLPMMPWFARRESQNITKGFLHSTTPGRTDQLPIGVKAGSYVLPASHLAALGQENSLAGAAKVSKMFGMTPAGTPPMHAGRSFHMPSLPRPPRLPGAKPATMAMGGTGKTTPIVAAGGEFVIPPEAIIRKYGSLERGHRELDKWVVDTRKKHIQTLKNLKGPKGAK